MITVLIIALVVVFYTLQSLFTRLYTDHYPGDQSLTTPVFAVVCGLIVAAVSFGFSGFSFHCSLFTVLLGVINAVVLYGYDSFIIKGSATGPYSIVMTFSLTGAIAIPAVVSWIFFDAPFSVTQLVSMLVIFGSVLMISKKEGGEENPEHKKHRATFLIVCTLLGLSNGLYGVLLNTQQIFTGVAEKEEMVTVTFIGAALISLVQLFVKEKKNALKAFRQTKTSLLYLLLTSVISALAINVLVIAIDYADSTLVYTFDNAGVLLLSVLASAVLFREKLSKLNVVGCVIMSLGLIAMTQAENIEAFVLRLIK